MMVSGTAEFEPPDVVAVFGTREEADFTEIHQIAIDGGLVKSERCESVGKIGVRQWAGSVLKFLKDGDPGRGTAEAGFPDTIPKFRRGGGLRH